MKVNNMVLVLLNMWKTKYLFYKYNKVSYKEKLKAYTFLLKKQYKYHYEPFAVYH